MCNDKDILLRHYLEHSVVGLPKKSLATTEEVDELLRKISTTYRPESSSFASSEYYCIFHVLCFCLELKVESL